jgi:formamidopyrimidine-DNA glycosylase
MPELPDVELYLSCIRRVAGGQILRSFRAFNPFVIRSVAPKPSDLVDLRLIQVSRIGKRVVLEFETDFFAVIHLMIAGRFRWVQGVAKPNKIVHAAFQFDEGALLLTEASTKKRASITLLRGREGLAAIDRGGLEISPDYEAFAERLVSENRTVKRALTSPALFSGIGNAYSDEILHAAKLSPLRHTQSLTEDEKVRLHRAILDTLRVWTERLQSEFAAKFPGPGDVTAFRPDFAAHGKFGQPCPVCGAKIQRIVYADNETNYCAQCQNEGRVLADRALSRLLKDDWPRTLEED